MVSRKIITGLIGLAAGVVSSVSLANTIQVQEVTGPIGGSVEIGYSFAPADPATAAGFEICIEFDPLLTVADTSECVAGAPPGFDGAFTNCAPTPGCPGVTVQLAASNFTSLVPAIPSIGTLTLDIDGAAGDGSVLPVTVSCIALAAPIGSPALECGDLTLVDGSVEASAGPPAVLAVTPDPVSFGSGVAPVSLTGTATVANTGTAGAPDLTVTALDLGGADAGSFSITGGTCGAVPFDVSAGDSCTVVMTLNAAAVQAYAGTLTAVSSVGDETVDLTGEGTAGPQSTMTVDPLTVAFGTVLQPLPVCETITVSNTGDAGSSFTVTTVDYIGDAEFEVTDNCAGAVPPSCSIEVCFAAGAAAGSYSGSIRVLSTANNGGDQTVTVSGTAAANITVNPPFGPVNLGTAPAGGQTQASGQLGNTGSAAGSVACTLDDPDGVFSTLPTPLEATVAPGATVPFTLFCDIPDGAAVGTTYNATLTCSVDGAVAGTHDLSCSAGVALPAIPVNTLQPWALVLFALMMLLVGGISIRFFRMS